MNKSRLELKVGLFVLTGLILLALLLLQFSKGASLFRPTYALFLTTQSAGGLKPRAGVLMSGVQVGKVSDIQLSPSGTNVTITLAIYKKYIIRDDAEFSIKLSGFLGDNYIDINPRRNEGKEFKDQDHAQAVEPFDLQEVARSAGGFIRRVDDAARNLNEMIADVRRLTLNETTLTNLAVAIVTMRDASERALNTMSELDDLLSTNGPAISLSASNLIAASESLTRFADSLNAVLATNSPGVSASVKNIESSTVVLNTLLKDAQAGKGLAGTLLQNEQVAANVANIVQNLSITSSNLNRAGLWGILWSKKPPRTNRPAPQKLTSPRSPFD